MFDWLGSLAISERTPHRVVLRLARRTAFVGWTAFLVGVALFPTAWSVWPYFGLGPGLLALFGLTLATLRRELEVDRALGEVRVYQRVFGVSNSMRVPLLHVRAVVIVGKHPTFAWMPGPRFVAYLDRRVGDAIFIDESRRAKTLLKLGEAIADAAEVRLEYEPIEDFKNAGLV
jgi:hypothetical protein